MHMLMHFKSLSMQKPDQKFDYIQRLNPKPAQLIIQFNLNNRTHPGVLMSNP